jgi:hypothetical protein
MLPIQVPDFAIPTCASGGSAGLSGHIVLLLLPFLLLTPSPAEARLSGRAEHCFFPATIASCSHDTLRRIAGLPRRFRGEVGKASYVRKKQHGRMAG